MASLSLPIAALLLGAPVALPAQGPETDVWLVPLRAQGGVVSLGGAAINVTDRPGYDNQPSFTPDGAAILYTSQRDGQTDIHRYDLRTRETTQLTRTPESEYSPTVMPDGRSLAVVRVEADSTQRLWRFPLRGDGAPALVLPDVRPVGYFAFADRGTLALFVLGGGGQPNTLQVARVGAGVTDTVMTGIGRSLHRIPGTTEVSFVQAASAPRWITALDPRSHAMRRLAQPVEGSEDFAWLDRRTMLMASGARLYQHGPDMAPEAAWRPVGELGVPGRVSRLAVSPRGDWLAFVVQADAPAPAAAGPVDTTATIAREADVHAALAVLAADSLAGRRTGTAGAHVAARFIAERFAELGLRPGGDSTGTPWAAYLQRVPLRAEPQPDGGMALRVPRDRAALDTVPAARRVIDANVIGIIPGADPALRDEVVLVTAHYDHVGLLAHQDSARALRTVLAARGGAAAGRGGPPPAPFSAAERATHARLLDSLRRSHPAGADSVFNGADDDASGTVALIEIARQLLAGPPPKRTVIFAAMAGEERGLLGTNWYLDNPVVPLERTVANLNVEMIGRPDSLAGGPGKAWLTGYERSTMGDILRTNDIPLVPDPRPAQNFFERSDNIGFARRGIPAHTISSFGLHTDYHQVTDELSTIDLAHMVRVIDATARATRLLADGAKPEWHPGGRP